MGHLRIRVAVAAATLVALALPGVASAAGRPTATTGGAASITQSSVTLTGTVTPNGAATTYFFQYGLTSLYGTQTAAGVTSRKTTVAVPVAGLAPFTTYHYRLVAQNSHGLSKGKDRHFRTKRQPLGVSLIATPNPVPFGRSTTLQGILSGTGNSGRTVVLESNPFPYVQGFGIVGNAQVTNAQGQFFFPLLSLPITTQFRVQMGERPDVISPIITVYAQVRVTAHVRTHRTRRGKVARFYGAVLPANDSAAVAVQRFSKGQWRTVAGTITRHNSASSSRYSKRVRIRHTGRYRVFVTIANGQYASSASRTIHLRRR